MADSTASEPPLAKNTLLRSPGASSASRAARRIAWSLENSSSPVKYSSRRICCAATSARSARPWPSGECHTPPPAVSSSSLPSASQTRQPSPRTMIARSGTSDRCIWWIRCRLSRSTRTSAAVCVMVTMLSSGSYGFAFPDRGRRGLGRGAARLADRAVDDEQAGDDVPELGADQDRHVVLADHRAGQERAGGAGDERRGSQQEAEHDEDG